MSAQVLFRRVGLLGAVALCVLAGFAGYAALAAGSAVAAPVVSTGGSSAVAKTSATLEGSVNPGGEAVTLCQFEYGPGPAEVEGLQNETYSDVAACVPAAPGSGSTPVAVTAQASALEPGTVYHYRLAAGDSKGLGVGRNGELSTLQAVSELQSEAVTDVEEPVAGSILATLNGSLSPEGAATHYYFEYGETEAYGSASPTKPGTEVKGTGLEHAQTQLSGLKAETTYHYRLVATNSVGTTVGGDMTFTTPGVVPDVQSEAASGVELSGRTIVATLNGSLAPNGQDTHYYFEYGETEAYGSVSPALPGTDAGSASRLEHVHTQITGLLGDTTYYYRLVATSSLGTTRGAGMTLETGGLPLAPLAGVLPASNVTQFTATLNGTLGTGGLQVDYHFEYGTTTAYGQIAPIPDDYTPLTAEPVVVSQPVGNLQAGTTYHYRLMASSPGGTEIAGPDETFTTLPIPAPAVETGGSSGVGVGTATVTGTIDPHGWDTTYLFQYGTSTAYGQSWPTIPIDMGALEGSQPVTIGLLNLLPNTTYHYRLVATSGGGTTYGPDMTFATGEYPAQVIQEPVATGTLLVPTGGEVLKSTGASKSKKKHKSKKHKKGKKAKTGKARNLAKRSKSQGRTGKQ
jgi:hypothetical protein